MSIVYINRVKEISESLRINYVWHTHGYNYQVLGWGVLLRRPEFLDTLFVRIVRPELHISMIKLELAYICITAGGIRQRQAREQASCP